MPFFSIIVPIYKVEPWLRQCVDSILAQTWQDYELLLVDDGSPDDCPKICDEYAAKDTRVQAIHKANGGLSSARNEGFRHASGTWIVFFDSDDWWDTPDFLANAAAVIQKQTDSFDLLRHGYERRSDTDPTRRISVPTGALEINWMPTEQQIPWLVQADRLSVSAWSYVIRADYLRQHAGWFCEELKREEDIEWSIRLLAPGPRIQVLEDTSYIYRVRATSISHTKPIPGRWRDRYTAITMDIQTLESYTPPIPKERKRSLYSYLAYQYYILVADIARSPDRQDRRDAWRQIESLRYLQEYSTSKKARASRMMIKLFGVRIGGHLLAYKIRLSHLRRGV